MFNGVWAWLVEPRSYVGLPIGFCIIRVVVAVASQQDHGHLWIAHAADQDGKKGRQSRAQHLKKIITCKWSEFVDIWANEAIW